MDRARTEAGIRERLQDAALLWQAGRRESALLLALAAMGARARIENPGIAGDRAAFLAYSRSTHPWTMEIELRGKPRELDDILYTWVRCELVHEADLPEDVVICDALGGDDELVVRAGGAPDHQVQLSPGWFWHIYHCAEAPPPTS